MPAEATDTGMTTILEIFGNLKMGTAPAGTYDTAARLWSEQPFNRWAMLASVLIVLLNLREILHISPHIWKCATRWRWNLTIDNSMQLVHARTLSAIALLPAIALVFSRYSGVDWDALTGMGHPWTDMAPVAAVLAFVLLRQLAYLLISLHAGSPGTMRSAHDAGYNYFILLASTLLPTIGILYLSHASDTLARCLLGAETLLAYVVFLVHESRILRLSYRPFEIILYLCGFEVIPCGIIMVPFAL